jgi:hypothetical protein
MKHFPIVILSLLAFVVLTAAGASRFVNGTEIPQGVTLLYSTGNQNAAFGNVTVGGDLLLSDLAASATAGTGGQGNGAFATTLTRFGTVTTSNDGTLPAAAAGLCVFVGNASASTLDVFPASGDAINATSANTAIALATGEAMLCCAVDATQWICVIGSGT